MFVYYVLIMYRDSIVPKVLSSSVFGKLGLIIYQQM
jgi:hypothetical protein